MNGSEPDCFKDGTFSLEEASCQLAQFNQSSQCGTSFLALGQTIFWDEPMKASLALAAQQNKVRFVAGVHDTDYFAKMPGAGNKGQQGFKTLPHNDGSTKGLWSAAAEFSVLFGSETVITKDDLVHAGLKFDRLSQRRSGFLEQATEAWGWRGIVSLSDSPPITNETKMDLLVPELCSTLNWATASSAEMIGGESGIMAHKIHATFCESADLPGQNLASVYRSLLKPLYELVSHESVELETTQTSELLRFNSQTVGLPRFEFLRFFVESKNRHRACDAYDESIKGFPGLYELSKFGTGAIPFDLVVPGVGRGTIRIGNRGIVINTPTSLFLSFRHPIESLEEFAAMIEAKFGPHCSVIGKAVTLIGLLGKEFVFAFHEGASSYVAVSKKLHRALDFRPHPILRIKYHTWDSLSKVCAWFKLPSVLQHPFGVEEVCAPTFASRWETVGSEQRALLEKFTSLRKPYQLLTFLSDTVGGGWSKQREEYEAIQAEVGKYASSYQELNARRKESYQAERVIKAELQKVQSAKGEHFRAFIFEQEAGTDKVEERAMFDRQLENLETMKKAELILRSELGTKMQAIVKQDGLVRLQERRAEIELEAELKRLKMIREALVAAKGLKNADRRPSAWWIPMVSPDGSWFREISRTAECYWEPMA